MSSRIHFRMLITLLIVVVALGVVPAHRVSAARGPVVSPRGDPGALAYGGVRFRAFGNYAGKVEVFQGTDLNPPSPAGTLVTQNLFWEGANTITFTYDADAHTLTSQVNNNPALVFSDFAPTGPLNYLRIIVAEMDATTPASTVDFDNVVLDATSLGSFTTSTPSPQPACQTLPGGWPANSWCTWRVTGYDLTDGFTVTGTIRLSGPFSTDAEASKVELVAGYLDDTSVTGGGWYTSAAGAYLPNPTLSGQAQVNVTARRSNDRASVEGSVKFRLDAAGLNFQSTTTQWLALERPGEATVQLTGRGTINGKNAPNGQPYYYTCWAGDGPPSTWRLRIFYFPVGGEQVVYDNGFLQPLEGGNVAIHRR